MTEKTSSPAATGMQEGALAREARREALVFVASFADEITTASEVALECGLMLKITPRHRRALWTIAETLRAKARPKILPNAAGEKALAVSTDEEKGAAK